MEENLKVRFVGDASSLEAASKQSTAALDDVIQSVKSADITWREFVGQRMGSYMKQFGGHGGAIKQIAKEWQDYKASLGSVSSVQDKVAASAAHMAHGAGVAGGALPKMAKAGNEATQSMINLGRVVQDAPYGFIGIANNLNPLLESFQRLKASSGSSGAALKALGSSFIGAGGLGFALSIASSLLVVFGDRIFGASKKAADAKSPIEQLKKAYEDLRDTSSSDILGKAGSEFTKAITAIESLKENVKLAKEGFIDKKETIAQYNKELGDTIGKVKTLDEVEQQIASKGQAYLKFTLLKAAAQQALQKASDAALLAAQNSAKADVLGDNPLLAGIQKAIKGINTGGDANQTLDAFNKNIGKFSSKFKVQADEANHQKDRFIDIFKQFQDEAAKIGKENNFSFSPDISESKSKGDKSKFSFLFDFLPFDPSGKLNPEQRSQLLEATSKFQKEFEGIFKGVGDLSIGSDQQRIQKSIQFDLKLKAGKVQFDLTKIREATDKAIKAGDVIPESTVGEIDATIVDKFIRGFQNASDTLKSNNLFGDLFRTETPQGALEGLKFKLKQIGEQLPQTFQATNIFGKPVTVTLDELLDFTKVSPGEAIKVLQNTFGQIISELDMQKAEMNIAFAIFSENAFSSIGEGIGEAIANGANAIQTAANSIGEAIGSLVQQIGKALVKYGIVKTGLDQVIKAGFALPGAAAIAIGIGAIAVGALIKASFANVKRFATGGFVPGVGNSDTVPAMLTPGEFVIPKNKVADFFNRGAQYATGSVQQVPYIAGFDISHDKVRLMLTRANKYGNTFGR